MSQANVKLAREVLAALGTRDPSRLIALSDPEVEWHSFFALGEGGGGAACITATTARGGTCAT